MLLKNSFRKIKKSFGRYLSLLIIIFIGVGFYAGIVESVPNIKKVQTKYYEDTNLMDLKIISPIGFTEDDVFAVNGLKSIDKAVGTYSKDVLIDDNVVRIHAIEEDINKSYLIEGRLPKKSNECLADADVYQVGEEIVISDDSTNLKNNKFIVVGTIYSPIYTSDDYGGSNIGNGKLYSYIYVDRDNFSYDYYTELFLTIKKSTKDVPYSDSYDDKVRAAISDIKELKQSRIDRRLLEMKDYLQQMNSSSLSSMSIDWYIADRGDVVRTYTILEDQYRQVTIIANVIPIFFIIIVALMTSNTMSRMITEERGEMGTLLSLGYSKAKIIYTYLMYVLSSTVIGAVLGYFVGTIFLPQLVYNCFPFNFPPITYQFRLSLFLICIVLASLLMTFVTVFACCRELKSRPAYLLRPVAPKSGKKIFMEQISFIWNKLSFSKKITFRNISRYKKRVLMTLVGSAGCTFLIMIGLALRDSINTVGDMQYSQLFKYDNMVVLSKNVKSIKEIDGVLDELIGEGILLNQSSFKVVNNQDNLDVYLVVPKNNDESFYKYFNLRDKDTARKEKLDDEGVIISTKIKDRFDVDVGDILTIESLDKEKFEVKVSAVTENYVSNYIYMSDKLYNKVFDDEIDYNVIVGKNISSKKKIATEILKNDIVLSVNFRDDLLENANELVNGLNEIVVLLVIISSLLAFTVLYNLTSINISERTREIATLKVLGFRDLESNNYIYLETLITVVIGIFLGLLMTPPLHNLVMELLEIDELVFLRQINFESYVLASVLSFTFAVIMQWITFFKLRKINMIESLKSVE